MFLFELKPFLYCYSFSFNLLTYVKRSSSIHHPTIKTSRWTSHASCKWCSV